MQLRRELVRLKVREDRPKYIAQRFRKYLMGKILDVGCDQAAIRDIVGRDNYTGVGMTEVADIKLDLEASDQLPFETGSWNTVICLDTLEHLNHLHAFSRELFRVAKNHVIISLPNCWCHARRAIARGKGAVWHYGLPLFAPADRHKWFFNTEEAYAFLCAQEKQPDFPARVVEIVALEHRRPLTNRIWRHIKHPAQTHYLNLYVNTVVAVFERL